MNGYDVTVWDLHVCTHKFSGEDIQNATGIVIFIVSSVVVSYKN